MKSDKINDLLTKKVGEITSLLGDIFEQYEAYGFRSSLMKDNNVCVVCNLKKHPVLNQLRIIAVPYGYFRVFFEIMDGDTGQVVVLKKLYLYRIELREQLISELGKTKIADQ